MSKVEQFIREHTRSGSNEIIVEQDEHYKVINGHHPWVVPNVAREAVKMAREETIKEVCEWIKNNVYSYTWCDFLQHERGVETGKLIDDLKNHLDRN